MRFTYTTGTWTCPTNIDNCPDPVFAPPIPLPIGPMRSVDAKVFWVNSNLEQIMVTGIRYDGSVIEIPVVLDSGGYPAWGTVTAISGAGAAIGELTLAVSQEKTSMAMVYKAPDHTVRYRSRSTSGWSAETQLLAGGSPIKMHPDTSPGLAFTGLPLGIAFGEYLVGAFTDVNGLVQLYTPGRIGQGWGKIPIPYDAMYSPVGRPVIGWVGSPGGIVATPGGASGSLSSTANRFYVLYLEYQTPPGSTPTNAVRMAMSHVDTAGTFRIGLDAYFDNVWAFAYGIGLVQPSDGALRAVVTSGVPSSLRTVHFRPQADGMRDLPYRNYDDWKTLGWGSCSTVAPTQTTMFIHCSPPW